MPKVKSRAARKVDLTRGSGRASTGSRLGDAFFTPSSLPAEVHGEYVTRMLRMALERRVLVLDRHEAETLGVGNWFTVVHRMNQADLAFSVHLRHLTTPGGFVPSTVPVVVPDLLDEDGQFADVSDFVAFCEFVADEVRCAMSLCGTVESFDLPSRAGEPATLVVDEGQLREFAPKLANDGEFFDIFDAVAIAEGLMNAIADRTVNVESGSLPVERFEMVVAGRSDATVRYMGHVDGLDGVAWFGPPLNLDEHVPDDGTGESALAIAVKLTDQQLSAFTAA